MHRTGRVRPLRAAPAQAVKATMKRFGLRPGTAVVAAVLLPGWALAQGAPTGQALESMLEQKSMAMPMMTAEQTARYRADYKAAKAQWAAMTPQQKAATVAAAREKRIADLTAIERFGQNDDMLQETAAQTARIGAEHDAAKAAWAKMTPAEKQAVTRAAWAKKRAELDALERVGQNDDDNLLPW